MNVGLVRLPAAAEDVDAAAAFIADASPEAAFRFLEAIEQTYSMLSRMPEMGVKRGFRSSTLTGLRMVPVLHFSKYLVFYRPSEDGVEIIRLLHAARDLESLFSERGE